MSENPRDVVMIINDVATHVKNFEQVFGKELFTNENLMLRIKRTSMEHFLKSLNVNEMDWSHSTIQSLQHLLTSGSTVIGRDQLLPAGYFAKRTANGYELPSARAVQRLLETTIKDPDLLRILKDEVMPFYNEFEMILKDSGNVVKFNNDFTNLQGITERFGGPEKILQFLKKTAELSEKGNVIDTINEGVRLEQIKQNILNAKESISQRANDVEQETRLKEQFKTLHTHVRDMVNLIRMAKLTKNYKLLAALGGSNRKLTEVLNTIEEFMTIDPTKEGPITLAYEQKILDFNLEASRLLNKQYGEINNDFYTRVKET